MDPNEISEQKIQACEDEFGKLTKAMRRTSGIGCGDLCEMAMRLYLENCRHRLTNQEFLRMVTRIQFDYADLFKKYGIEW